MNSLFNFSKDDTSNFAKFLSSVRKTEFKKKILFMIQMLLLEIRYVLQLRQRGKVSGFW
jgi:hypothetical protein